MSLDLGNLRVGLTLDSSDLNKVKKEVQKSTSSMGAAFNRMNKANSKSSKNAAEWNRKLAESARKSAAAAKKQGDDTAKAAAKADKALNKNAKTSSKTSKTIQNNNQRLKSSFDGLGAKILAVFSLEAARRVMLQVDAFRLLDARIKNATESHEAYVTSTKELIAISNRAGSELGNVVQLFQRIADTRSELGATNDQVLRVVDSIFKLGVVSGASTEELKFATRQISQALSGSIVRAEEWNSIIENTPKIAQAIAKAMQTTTGQLRKQVIEGKVLSRDVFEAILSQSKQIDEEFSNFPDTIARATNALKNELLVALSDMNEELHITGFLAHSIRGFSNWLKGTSPTIGEVKTKMAELNSELKDHQFTIESMLGPDGRPKYDWGIPIIRNAQEEIAKLEKQLGFLQAKLNRLQKESETEVSQTLTTTQMFDRPSMTGVDEMEGIFGDKEIQAAINANTKRIQKIADADIEAHVEAEIRKRERMGQEVELTEAQLQEKREKAFEIRKQYQLESEEQLSRQIYAIEKQREVMMLNSLQTLGDNILQILEAGGKEQTALYKALFLANKAIQVAQIIASTQVGAAQALAMGPAGIPIAGMIEAAGFSSAALVAGLAIGDVFGGGKKGGGRQAGGQVSAGLMHPINEDGRPEILVQGTKQYLLTGNKSGRIIGAGDLAANNAMSTPKITMNNFGTPQQVVSAEMVSQGELRIALRDVENRTVKRIDRSLSSGRGSTSKALMQGNRVERNLR